MEQSVVLTKFRKEGSFNFNNRVPVLPPVAAETENFQEQKSRFTPEVSMAVEATSQPALALAANTQVSETLLFFARYKFDVAMDY